MSLLVSFLVRGEELFKAGNCDIAFRVPQSDAKALVPKATIFPTQKVSYSGSQEKNLTCATDGRPVYCDRQSPSSGSPVLSVLLLWQS
jgi:hypothetical protein